MRADLHIHTTASDGRWPPERVVAEVKARAIGLFAVADHDTTAGVKPVETLVCGSGLAFLRGVEVSTVLDGHIFHILAYGFDTQAPALVGTLRENAATMEQYNEDTIYRFAAAGYPIDPDEYAGYEYDCIRGGWKVLNFMIDQGLCSDIHDFLDNLIVALPAEVPSFLHPSEAIAAIREAGGVPILAHPGASLRHVSLTEGTLSLFLEFNVAGLECYSPYHDEAVTRFFLDWCARHALLVTGGSDCHGGLVGRELGIPNVDTADLRLGELEERIVR